MKGTNLVKKRQEIMKMFYSLLMVVGGIAEICLAKYNLVVSNSVLYRPLEFLMTGAGETLSIGVVLALLIRIVNIFAFCTGCFYILCRLVCKLHGEEQIHPMFLPSSFLEVLPSIYFISYWAVAAI